MGIMYNVLNKDEMRTKFLRNLNNVFVLYLPFYIFMHIFYYRKEPYFLSHYFVLTIILTIVWYLQLKLVDKIHQKLRDEFHVHKLSIYFELIIDRNALQEQQS